MRKVALRGLFARKLRLALTALAVALGTTLIAGHLRLHRHDQQLLRQDLHRSPTRAPTRRSRRTRRSTRPTTAARTPTVPGRVLDQVAPAAGRGQRRGLDLRRRHGPAARTASASARAGAPNFLASVADVPRFQGFTLKTGRRPQNADEAAIDAATADEQGLEGRRQGLRRRHRAAQGATRSSASTQIAGVELVRRRRGRSTSCCPRPSGCSARATASTRSRSPPSPASRPQQLSDAAARARSAATVDVRTGQEQAAKQSQDIRDNLGFLKTALLAFAGISLFVGAFIIFNTFSITVAQRMREFALLRTLGASRRQVCARSSARGSLLGVVGGVVGLLLGHRDGRAPARAVQGRRRRPAVATASSSRRARSSSRSLVGHGGQPSSPASPRRCAPRACRRSRRCARASCRSQRGRGRRMAIGAGRAARDRRGAHVRRAVRQPEVRQRRDLRFMGGGAALTFLGVALLSPAARAAAGARSSGGRSSARPASPAGWRARTRSASPGAPRSPPRRS